MSKKKKASFGYLPKQSRKQGIYTLVFLIICAGMFVSGYMLSQSPKNIATIAAVLGLLPTSKSSVSFIMYMKAEKHTCSKELFDKVNEIHSDDNGIIMFDSYMTSYDKNYPVLCGFIKNGCYIGYTDTADIAEKCKDYILEYMGKNEISGYTVKIFDNEKNFVNRLSELAQKEIVYDENDLKLMTLINNLSL